MSSKTQLNLITFIALMGTSALSLATYLLFPFIPAKVFSYILEISILLIFSFYLLKFFKHICEGDIFISNLKNPMVANLYSAIAIASALITIMLSLIGLPGLHRYDVPLALAFWIISFVLSIFFLVVIPINLKFRSKTEHVFGTWFLPPVGIFVLITAGANLALKSSSLLKFINLVNMFLLGPAFILYFLTLTLVYFRSKFYDVEEQKMTPTFNIVLAPVAVSVLAMISLTKTFNRLDLFSFSGLFSGLTKFYSLIALGYGFWVVLGLLALLPSC
ncbi:MAG TPA: hypothetical protein ENL27_01375 [Candidatus Parcubacteria bacterium]|nr:hypothetical protein [Candidatus Parcubacteria bacterium]